MLGDKIKELRKKFGYSQQQLANKMHLTQGAISQWENNLTVPAADQLVSLSQIFGITVDELLGENQIVSKDHWDVESVCFEPTTPEEYRLLSGFRSLNEAGQRFILQTLDTAVASNIYKQGDLPLGKEA